MHCVQSKAGMRYTHRDLGYPGRMTTQPSKGTEGSTHETSRIQKRQAGLGCISIYRDWRGGSQALLETPGGSGSGLFQGFCHYAPPKMTKR